MHMPLLDCSLIHPKPSHLVWYTSQSRQVTDRMLFSVHWLRQSFSALMSSVISRCPVGHSELSMQSHISKVTSACQIRNYVTQEVMAQLVSRYITCHFSPWLLSAFLYSCTDRSEHIFVLSGFRTLALCLDHQLPLLLLCYLFLRWFRFWVLSDVRQIHSVVRYVT